MNLKPFNGGLKFYSHVMVISIHIKDNYRNKKYGAVALNYMDYNARKLGYNTILAKIPDFDNYGQRLFKSMNFIKYGYLPNIIDNRSRIHGLYIFGKRYYKT